MKLSQTPDATKSSQAACCFRWFMLAIWVESSDPTGWCVSVNLSLMCVCNFWRRGVESHWTPDDRVHSIFETSVNLLCLLWLSAGAVKYGTLCSTIQWSGSRLLWSVQPYSEVAVHCCGLSSHTVKWQYMLWSVQPFCEVAVDCCGLSSPTVKWQ